MIGTLTMYTVRQSANKYSQNTHVLIREHTQLSIFEYVHFNEAHWGIPSSQEDLGKLFYRIKGSNL